MECLLWNGRIDVKDKLSKIKLTLLHCYSWMGREECPPEKYCEICQSQRKLIDEAVKFCDELEKETNYQEKLKEVYFDSWVVMRKFLSDLKKSNPGLVPEKLFEFPTSSWWERVSKIDANDNTP